MKAADKTLSERRCKDKFDDQESVLIVSLKFQSSQEATAKEAFK